MSTFDNIRAPCPSSRRLHGGNAGAHHGQLLDAATGAHLWADRFDGSLEDIFELQDKVAAAQIRCTLRWLIPAALAIARPVQCVAWPGGSASVISTTRSIVAGDNGGLPAGRVASCSKPSTPSAMHLACQRQIVGLPLPVCRWIAIVP